MKRKPNVIAMTYSRRWNSAIPRALPDARLRFAVDLENLKNEILNDPLGSAILECDSQNLRKVCQFVSTLENSSFHFLFFAVGEEIDKWQPVLKTAGFVGVSSNPGGLGIFEDPITRHQNSYRCNMKESLETRILRSLPWASAARRLKSLKSVT